MALVTDIVPPAELVGFIRELDPTAYGFTLNQFLPDQQREEIEYAFERSDRTRQVIAEYRAFDVEAPIAKRPGFTRVRGEIPPLSLKIQIGEELRLRLNAMRNNGDTAQIAERIFSDAELLTEAALARIELARGEALFKATVTFNVDSGFLSTMKVNYGTATTITAPGTLWSTVATATPLKDLGVMVNDYRAANNGRPPALALTSDKVLKLILQAAEVKSFAGASGFGILPSIVTQTQLSQILDSLGLPQIRTYDTMVNINGTSTRVTPLNDLALLPGVDVNRFGETTFGVTAEALDLVSSGFLTAPTAPGLVGVVEKNFDPVATWTKVAGLPLPVIKDPKLVASVTVSA
jgi:hypothetical protein